ARRRAHQRDQPRRVAVADELALALEHADGRRMQIEPVGGVERVDGGDHAVVIDGLVRLDELGARAADDGGVDAVEAQRALHVRALVGGALGCTDGGEAGAEEVDDWRGFHARQDIRSDATGVRRAAAAARTRAAPAAAWSSADPRSAARARATG